jgi:predicted DsbA family dithiol-disulfide isomerase
VESLYRQYFEEERHPSSRETLLRAATDAGFDVGEAENIVGGDEEDDAADEEGLQSVKALIREQAGNGIDAVPYIVIEGKRRDLTLEGAKDVDAYVKALRTIIKESS